MTIDNPSEKIRELVKDDDFDGVGAALQVGGIFSPILKVVGIAKSIGTSRTSGEKIRIAIIALCDELERIQDRWPKDFESALDTDWFKRAMTVLMEESARAVNGHHARLLARVAAQGCFPSAEHEHRQEDLGSYIHDLARLGVDDIQMLKILGNAYKDVLRNSPNLHDPNLFTNHNESFKHAADKSNIHPDDRLSLGARLSGFGLALESVPQTEGRFFRPTRRGFYLLSLLEAAEIPVQQQ